MLLLSFGLGWVGCKSAEQKCSEAQGESHDAWQAYLQALESDHRKAVETERAAKTTMAVEIEKRVALIAAERVDRKIDRRNSEAWQRSYQAAHVAVCAEDPECERTQHAATDARRIAEELEGRAEAARVARDSAKGPVLQAKKAAKAVPRDYERREPYAAAIKASKAAYHTCDKGEP